MNTSETTASLYAAMSKAQASAQTVGKRGSVSGSYGYDYAKPADIFAVWQECGASNGLAVVVTVSGSEYTAGVRKTRSGDRETLTLTAEAVCRITHESGEWMDIVLPVSHDVSGGMQPIGAVLSYARKYAVISALCLAVEDVDDMRAREREQRNDSPRAATKAAQPPRESAPAAQPPPFDAATVLRHLEGVGYSREMVEEFIGSPVAEWTESVKGRARELYKLAEGRSGRPIQLVESESSPGTWHLVTIGAGDSLMCGCPAGKHGKPCRHLDAVVI